MNRNEFQMIKIMYTFLLDVNMGNSVVDVNKGLLSNSVTLSVGFELKL
jgi:hypothetical protein